MNAVTVFLILVSWVIVWFIGATYGESRGYNNGYEQAKRIWKPRATSGEEVR